MTIGRAPILPTNATPLERSLAAVDGRLEDIDVAVIRQARDPGDAPAGYLPFLAWERSVDVWDPAWPEDVKRAVVAAAPIVHRYKGTRHAVQTALAALQIDVALSEWWQRVPAGTPYTFRATIYARARLYDGPVLDDRLVAAARAAIMSSKPLSRAFDLAIGAAFPARLGAAAGAAGIVKPRAVMHPVMAARGAAALGLGAAGAGQVRCRAVLHPTFSLAASAALGCAAAAAGRVRVHTLMIAEAA